MRRANHLFERIWQRENLRLAVAKALRGKRHRADARQYMADLNANLRFLRDGIVTNSIGVGRFRQFTIYDPKQRTITAPCFEERVLHHAIMNVCEPTFERYLIFDTYACRKRKGREACVLRAAKNTRRFPYYAKLDIRKYFDSVAHPVLLRMLARRFKEPVLLALFERIIASYQATEERGLPIGSLTSQHFANFYLGCVDRFVTEHLKTRGYVRYMDDFILWGDDLAQITTWCQRIDAFIRDELCLEFKKTPVLNHRSQGVPLLGCVVFATHTVLSRRSRRRFASSLRHLEMLGQLGEISEAAMQVRLSSLVAFSRAANARSWEFRRRVIESEARVGHGRKAGRSRRELE